MVDQGALLSRLNKLEADMRAKLLLHEILLPMETQEKESGQGQTQEKLIRSTEHVADGSCMLLINKFNQELQKERNRRVKVENTVSRLRASIVKMAQNISDVSVSKRMALGAARQLRKLNERKQISLSESLVTKHENTTLRKQLLEEKTKQQNLELQLTEIERKIKDGSTSIITRSETGDAAGKDFTVILNNSPNWKYEEAEQVVTSDEQIYHDCQSEPLAYEQKVWCNVSTHNIHGQKALQQSNKPNSLTRKLSSVSLQEKRTENDLSKNTSKGKYSKTVGSQLASDFNFSPLKKTNSFKYEEISTVNHESWRKTLIKTSSEISHKFTEKHSPRYIYDWLRENVSFPAKYFHNPRVQSLNDHSCSATEKKLEGKLKLLEIQSSRKSDERRFQYSEIAIKLFEYKRNAEISNEELQKVRSQCAELQKQLDDYKKSVDEKLRTEILYRNKELETKMEECKKASKEFQQQILQAESRYKDLSKELETLRQESDFNCLEKEKSLNPDILNQLYSDFTILEDNFIALKSEMKEGLKEKDKLFAAMVIRERTLVEERENLKKTVGQLQHQSHQHLNTIKEMSTTISKQEELIHEQIEIMNDKKNEVTEITQFLEMSRRENRTNRKHLSYLKYQLYITTIAFNKLKVVSKDMQLEENNVLKQELEQIRLQLDEKNSMMNLNEKQRIQEHAICQMLERDLEEHKKLLSELTKELSYYKQENETLKMSHKKLHTNKVIGQKKLEMFRSKCRKWAQWQQEINSQQKRLSNQIEVLKGQRDTAISESKHITQKLLKAMHNMSDK